MGALPWENLSALDSIPTFLSNSLVHEINSHSTLYVSLTQSRGNQVWPKVSYITHRALFSSACLEAVLSRLLGLKICTRAMNSGNFYLATIEIAFDLAPRVANIGCLHSEASTRLIKENKKVSYDHALLQASRQAQLILESVGRSQRSLLGTAPPNCNMDNDPCVSPPHEWSVTQPYSPKRD